MSIKSNGTTFFLPAAMQLARGEDFARGMRCDVTDYRAMLAREIEKTGHRPQMWARQVAAYELHFDRPFRESFEHLLGGRAVCADDAQRYNYRNVVG